jgi:orotate phosphoribosyltransferase
MRDYRTEVANGLLEIGAVKLQPNEPFTWASGLKSPIYTDNRMTIGFPAIRQVIAKGLSHLIKDTFGRIDVIGGVATAGIPHAAWVAADKDVPMIYVRSKPKDHGAGRQIEGADVAGQKVVLIDDLISTGGSVLGAVEAVRQAGGEVVGVVAIFSYGLKAADENFGAAKVPFVALTGYDALIDAAVMRGDVSESELATLRAWRENPAEWGENK